MSRRRRAPVSGSTAIAAGIGLAVFFVGTNVGFGFFVSVLLAVISGAAMYARIRPRQRTQPAQQQVRQPPAPEFVRGYRVEAIRHIGGALGAHVPQGARGVITSVSWNGRVYAQFTVFSPTGDRTVPLEVNPNDIRRI